MADRNYLAFDLGAESGRSVLGKLANGRLTLDVTHRFANPTGTMNGRLQWNLLAQWEELKTGLRKTALAANGVKLDGIGVDTWGVDFGFVGPDGEVLGNPTTYRDTRTAGMMDALFARVPRDEVFAATGLQFMSFNSLYQLEAIRQRSPRLFEEAKALLFVPDLFHYLFSGRMANESTIASTSQMLDPRTGKWATELLAKLGLPHHLLQEVVPAGTTLGMLKADVAAECGLSGANAVIPIVVPATHDTASAVAAVPATEGGSWCYISSGTWSLMGVELDAPIINAQSLALNYTNEGGVNGTTRFLKNIMGLWLVQECRRQWIRKGSEYNYTQLTQMAADATPFVSLVDPNYEPLLTPGDMPGKIASFCTKSGQPVPATVGATVRCCLESLAMAYRKTLEGLESVVGHRIGTIHIVGGGCQNELLNQMGADACDRVVIAGPVEATAAGNVLTQAIGRGDLKSLADARAVVRASFDVKRFEPRNAAAWRGQYERFRALA